MSYLVYSTHRSPVCTLSTGNKRTRRTTQHTFISSYADNDFLTLFFLRYVCHPTYVQCQVVNRSPPPVQGMLYVMSRHVTLSHVISHHITSHHNLFSLVLISLQHNNTFNIASHQLSSSLWYHFLSITTAPTNGMNRDTVHDPNQEGDTITIPIFPWLKSCFASMGFR